MFAKVSLFVVLLMSLLTISIALKSSENFEVEAKEACDSDDAGLPIPVSYQRYVIIQATLDELGIYAEESIKRAIMELTFGFDKAAIEDLVKDIVNNSRGASIEKEVFFSELKKAIQEYDSKKNADGKLRRLKQLASEITLIQNDNLSNISIQPVANKTNSSKQYPLFDDVYHPNKEIFIEAAKQLKKGKLSDDFPKGILLYGPPGVGKNEMVKAIMNESGCSIFIAKGSRVVGGHQGSGARAIESVFDQARTIEPAKGVVVLIDELQSLTPVTSDKNVSYAYKHSGLDYENALTQLWLEYDKCLEEYDNILIIATCNQFDRIDERIRGRFDCIEFSLPDIKGIIEILRNKSEHFEIYLSESELEKYAEKMKGLSGRELNKFITKVKGYIRRGRSKKDALEQALRDYKNNTENANPKIDKKRFEKFKDAVLGGMGHGIGTAVGGGIVAGVAALCMLLIKRSVSNNGAANSI